MMNYKMLVSIVASKKVKVADLIEKDSFCLQKEPVEPYIEPDFSKKHFPSEKPSILLISAVGASGKTTTAKKLAYDTQLPILDLAKHRPVADRALTGLLTDSYPLDQISTIFGGLANGTYGVIIDGIDEGRTKVNEKGFEAFLDDIVDRVKNSPATAVVIFGRGQALENTWCYLLDRNTNVGFLSIDPFDQEKASCYIDSKVIPEKSKNYIAARDRILERLKDGFANSHDNANDFLSFIGYPPVLDAVATLLSQERNYHKICNQFSEDSYKGNEVELLVKIGDYLIQREHAEKAFPNFIESMLGIYPKISDEINRLYSKEEQCARVLAGPPTYSLIVNC